MEGKLDGREGEQDVQGKKKQSRHLKMSNKAGGKNGRKKRIEIKRRRKL